MFPPWVAEAAYINDSELVDLAFSLEDDERHLSAPMDRANAVRDNEVVTSVDRLIERLIDRRCDALCSLPSLSAITGTFKTHKTHQTQ